MPAGWAVARSVGLGKAGGSELLGLGREPTVVGKNMASVGVQIIRRGPSPGPVSAPDRAPWGYSDESVRKPLDVRRVSVSGWPRGAVEPTTPGLVLWATKALGDCSALGSKASALSITGQD